MNKTLLPCLLFILFAFAAFGQTQPTRTYELRNGNWYNGKDFTPGTWYVVNGLLSKKTPSTIDSVVDLNGRWVTPPMGDAFCASVAENSSAANVIKLYAEEGTFYLQILSNTQAGRTTVQSMLNKPGAPDAVFGNGGLTCTLGYPFVKYEAPAQNIRNPEEISRRYDFIRQQRKMQGDGYWFIDSKAMLDKEWPRIKAQKPGVILIYLLDTKNSAGKENKGLTADAAKAIIKKAHKSDFSLKALFNSANKTDLQVYAYVETADDVRLGLQLGVDGFANMPGHDWDGSGDTKKFELTDADMQQLAKKKTAVITLFSHGQSITPRPQVQEFHLKTLKRLFDNNVNVVLGSDDPQRTGRAELNYWHILGSLDASSILKVLCENTPRAIFPKRKVGKLEEGYEASFLVLSDNPLTNILKIRASAYKMKNGQWVK